MKMNGVKPKTRLNSGSTPPAQIGVTVLGATGSIGISTLDVVKRHSGQFRIVALTAFSQVDRMLALCKIHQPEYVVMVDPDSAELLRTALSQTDVSTNILSGKDALEKVATLPQADYVMAAIVGAAGLESTLAAVKAGKRVLLANKEALVMSGSIFMNAVRDNQAELLPIDSEHNAIFQCMPRTGITSSSSCSGAAFSSASGSDMESDNLSGKGIRKILLTASGGPFRSMPLSELDAITPQQACAHPIWSMGKKISVDSATMMNKGLEVIEACWLFDTNPESIQVVLHPQSVVHSMVEYIDGSVLAQLGNPDMRTPIAHALAWPERIESGVEPLNLFEIANLEFEKPDYERFPCLRLAIEACKEGGTSPTILNAANEIAVKAFLDERLAFTGIARVVEKALENITKKDVDTLETVLHADKQTRQQTEEYLAQMGMRVN